jgi:hypothetical protein
MLTTMQLFVDGLHSIVMIATLLSHVVTTTTSNMLWAESALTIVILIQVIGVGLVVNMM